MAGKTSAERERFWRELLLVRRVLWVRLAPRRLGIDVLKRLFVAVPAVRGLDGAAVPLVMRRADERFSIRLQHFRSVAPAAPQPTPNKDCPRGWPSTLSDSSWRGRQ